MVDHPHAIAMSIELTVGSIRVLLVDTDLKLESCDPDQERSLHHACQIFVDRFPFLADTYTIRTSK